jgi:BolA protein
MQRIDKIKLLLSILDLTFCEIIDETPRHAGHINISEDQLQTHLILNISSKNFKGKTDVMIHRTIYGLLQEEFNNGLHALSINIVEEN